MNGNRSAWQPLVVDAMTGAEIEVLLARSVPYVYVPRFLDAAWCEEIVRRFDAAVESLPDHRSVKMGPARLDTLAMPVEVFVDSKKNRDRYFDLVGTDAPRVRALFEGGEDPLLKMRDVWRAGGWSEVPAAEDERRRYHPDTVWGLRDAVGRPHVDAYEHERPSALSRFKRHINYNVYLQNGDSGGHFIVYRKYAEDPYSSAFEALIDEEKLRDVERVEHRPMPGDLVIFDALAYHEVTRVDGTHRARVQAHSNLLVDPQSREFSCFA